MYLCNADVTELCYTDYTYIHTHRLLVYYKLVTIKNNNAQYLSKCANFTGLYSGIIISFFSVHTLSVSGDTSVCLIPCGRY